MSAWRPRRLTAGTVSYAMVVAAIVGSLVIGMASDTAASTAPEASKILVASGVAGALSLMLLRLAALVGPVVFSAADLQWPLSAPGSHALIVRARLGRLVAMTALAGLIAGVVAAIALAPRGAWTTGSVAGLVAALGISAAAVPYGLWLVQSSRRASRLAASPVLLAVAAGWSVLAVVVGTGGATVAALSCGPLAWPFVGFGAGSGGVAAAIGVAIVQLLALRFAARRRAGAMSLERFEARATVRSVLAGSITTLDWRALVLSLQRRPAAWTMRLPGVRPRGSRSATAWLFAALLARSPARFMIATLACVGAAICCLTAVGRDDSALGLVAVLAGYVAATALAEPVRVAFDSGGRTQAMLGRSPGQVVVAQAILCGATVAGVTALAVVIGALVVGQFAGTPAILLGVPALAAAGTAAATGSARAGGRVPTSLVVATAAIDPQTGFGVLAVWLIRWPLAALAIGAGPVSLATTGPSSIGAVAGLLLATVAAIAVGAAVLVHSGELWPLLRARVRPTTHRGDVRSGAPAG